MAIGTQDGRREMKVVNQDLTADEALALDYALGILRTTDQQFVRRRMGEDAAFALLVARCQLRLSVKGESNTENCCAGPVPSPEIWDAILARICPREQC